MITKEEIDNLATLARLELAENEKAALQKDISTILEYVGQVSAVAISDTKTTPLLHNVLRKDTLRPEDDLLAGKEEAVRASFPKSEGNYNVVRKIIQKDE